MKPLLLLCSLITFLFGRPSLSDELCNKNEEVIISFQTKNNSKTISVCKEKNGKYLVYRFGTKDRVELQYPDKLDETSWNKFYYRGAWRFGGKQNAGFGDFEIKFTNKNVTYKIYEDWNDEDSSADFGLLLETKGTKEKSLVMNPNSKQGTLLKLSEEKRLKNHAEDE